MATPDFVITDPAEGDVLVYSGALNAFVNVPSPSTVGRAIIYCSKSPNLSGNYEFEWDEKYSIVVELIGRYYTTDITIPVSLLGDSDFPLNSQFGSSNLITPDAFVITIPAGKKFGSSDIIFSAAKASDQVNPVHGKIFTGTPSELSVVIVNNFINNTTFTVDISAPPGNLRVFYGYTNLQTAPTLNQLLTPAIDGTSRFISVFSRNPISANFAIVCDSPILQLSPKYYWVIIPSTFTQSYTTIFDGSIILPYTIDGLSYRAYYVNSQANYLVLK